MIKKEQGQDDYYFQSTRHTSHITNLHVSPLIISSTHVDVGWQCEKYALLIERIILSLVFFDHCNFYIPYSRFVWYGFNFRKATA